MNIKKQSEVAAVYHGPRVAVDEFGTWHVIACGYADNDKFGYFICEMTHHDVGLVNPEIEYHSVKAFFEKISDDTYQEVLNAFGDMFNDS